MGKISTSGSFDSAPPSAVARDKSVRRSAQDDVFVASWRCKKPASSRISIAAKQVSAYGTASWVTLSRPYGTIDRPDFGDLGVLTRL